MAFTGLLLKGVGPFERLWLDLSDGQGNAHLGPHVIAGVNGSGKSTILKGLAWTLGPQAPGPGGFPIKDWGRSLLGWEGSGAVSVWGPQPSNVVCVEQLKWQGERLVDSAWLLEDVSIRQDAEGCQGNEWGFGRDRFYFRQKGGWLLDSDGSRGLVAGYSPSRVLRHIPSTDGQPSIRPGFGEEGALSFDGTVDNWKVQSWLKDILSRIALAKEKGQEGNGITAARLGIEAALSEVFGVSARLDTEIETGLELRFVLGEQSLDFSQLPDGVRNLLGWIVDFVRRRETARWYPEFAQTRPSVLLIDEVDAHLHPKWQRTVLTALRAAFPDVQIIVTTHSPFVVASCEEARVHVLGVREDGHAELRESMDAPVGESVMAIIKDVFGVSWYGVKTEQMLREWNDLKRAEAAGALSTAEAERLAQLTAEIAGRSDSLRSLVLPAAGLPQDFAARLGRK